MTKFQLFALLAHDGPRMVTVGGVTGLLSSLEREDGSGRCFNVTIYTTDGMRTVFVRTID